MVSVTCPSLSEFRLQKINSTLIALFPDYEAIPNSYYNRLFRLQKYIEKNLFSLEEVVENTREEIRDLDISDIAEAQKP